jgi:hypothetical protein
MGIPSDSVAPIIRPQTGHRLAGFPGAGA